MKFDVWLIAKNAVYRGMPFAVVADWIQQGRLQPEDKVSPTELQKWTLLGKSEWFSVYFLRDEKKVEDAAAALEPVELDFDWKPAGRRAEDEDDDPDMIPLIDISLVLLILFMMTTTVASISKVNLPTARNPMQIQDEKDPDLVWIEIELLKNDEIAYSHRRGPGPSIKSESEDDLIAKLLQTLDTMDKESKLVPEVRVSADRNLTYIRIQPILLTLDKLQKEAKIINYRIPVNEAKP